MTIQGTLFELYEGQQLQEIGKARFMHDREAVLAEARRLAKQAAISRQDQTATCDDVYHGWQAQGLSLDLLGPVAGSIFLTGEWVKIGWHQSRRESNHARAILRWKLK